MMVAAFAVALSGAPEIRPWLDANAKAIARIHGSKERRAQELLFAHTLRELQAQTKSRNAVDAPGAKAIAIEILANNRIYRFGGIQKAPPRTWWGRLVGWVQDRWAAILKALFGRVHVSGAAAVLIGDLLLGLSIVAFLFLLGRLVMQYGGGVLARANATPVHSAADPAALIAAADRDARLGNYARALTRLFEAALCRLHTGGTLSGDESETLGQLRKRVRSRAPQSYASFDAIAAALTLAVYADAPVGQTQWERARIAYETLTQERETTDAA